MGVWYNASAHQWSIFNEDRVSMPVGASFNVFTWDDISPFPGVYVHTTTVSNTTGALTYLNDPSLNNNPEANVLVTQNWNPGGVGGTYNPHAIGVWYNPLFAEWVVYNEDGAPLPVGAAFNVIYTANLVTSAYMITQVATASNTTSDSACINNALTNGRPDMRLVITHALSVSGRMPDGSAVWYNASLGEWCVFDSWYNTMPMGNEFFVLATGTDTP